MTIIFGESPWKKIPLPEPVHVEAGKHYEAHLGTDGVPSVREIPSGGFVFERDSTLTEIVVGEGGVTRPSDPTRIALEKLRRDWQQQTLTEVRKAIIDHYGGMPGDIEDALADVVDKLKWIEG